MRRQLVALMAAAVLVACESGTEQDTTSANAAEPATTTADSDVEQPSAPDPATESDTPAQAPGQADVPVAVQDATVRSITVGGMGAEYAPPTQCTVDMAVNVERPSVISASQAVASSGATLLEALDEVGVPSDAIQTYNFWINPMHDRNDYRTIIGYEATLGYRVTMPDVDDVGDALARVIEIGGDSVRASSVRFEGDPDGLMEQARIEAWDDVQARAEATADLLDEPLGPVLDAHEKVLITSPQGMMQGGEGDSATFDIPVAPGVTGVTVLLTVTYQIGD